MTKLEELKATAASAAAVIAVFEAARDTIDAECVARDDAARAAAWDAIWAPFQAELDKLKENSDD
jgi:hypothetical protein